MAPSILAEAQPRWHSNITILNATNGHSLTDYREHRQTVLPVRDYDSQRMHIGNHGTKIISQTWD